MVWRVPVESGWNSISTSPSRRIRFPIRKIESRRRYPAWGLVTFSKWSLDRSVHWWILEWPWVWGVPCRWWDRRGQYFGGIFGVRVRFCITRKSSSESCLTKIHYSCPYHLTIIFKLQKISSSNFSILIIILNSNLKSVS